MIQSSATSRISLPLRFVLGVMLIVGLSLWLFYWIMQPPMNDLGLMAIFLSITAVVSTVTGYTGYRLGWMDRSPSIRWTLLGAYVLSSILTFINVWLTARLMFVNWHDLLLATILLLFASGIALVLGYFFSSAMTSRIGELEKATRSLALGDLNTRIPVRGHDEIADLARTFNDMAAKLEAAAEKQKEVENLRRDLIVWVSHDLQTPLTSVRAIVEALADGVVEERETQERYLATVQREIASLSLLIDDLFQLAQLDAGGLTLDRAQNSLRDLVSEILESFSELASRQGVTLQGNVEIGVDPVWMDAQLVGRVLYNLVGNALRHTPSGGNVNIQVAAEDQDVCVEVVDTGEGIPLYDLPHVFERFYRGEKSRSRSMGGSGLGLAIARGIVEAHGGRMSVESVPDVRTCFAFTIPKQVRQPA